MGDPTGLVSLVMDGVGHLLKLKDRMERRKERLQQLSARLDLAHALLHSKTYPREDAQIYDEVLSPSIRDAIALLERARQLNRLSAARHVVFHATKDIEQASSIVARFESAAAEIESRRAAREAERIRVELAALRAHSEIVIHFAAVGYRRVMISLTIYGAAFLRCGEVSVTPHIVSKVLHIQAVRL